MFAAAFGDMDAADAGQDEGTSADDTPASDAPTGESVDVGTSPLEDASLKEVEASDDDLERAMRSLFPVLSEGEKEASGQDQDPGEAMGAAQTAMDAARASSEPQDASSAPESESPTSESQGATDSGTQFDAIKQDVQNREREKTGETSPDSSSTSASQKKKKSDDEASTEEIEKIWSILEDMD